MRNRYKLVVYWSEEDNCYIGLCPELFLGGVHGDDAQAVFNELREVVDWTIETEQREGRQLPAPTELV